MDRAGINWAVLGTGVIANEMAMALRKMGRKLYSVANRTHDKAAAFAEEYGVDVIEIAADGVALFILSVEDDENSS